MRVQFFDELEPNDIIDNASSVFFGSVPDTDRIGIIARTRLRSARMRLA